MKLLNDRINGVGSKHTVSFSKKVFAKYFDTILSLYDRINGTARITKDKYENGDELARALGVDPANVQFSVVIFD